MLIKILLAVGTFFFMEGVAWFTHKYIMHGVMWTWHKSHHVHHNEPLEKNDLFAVVFAVVSITTFALGTYVEGLWFLFWIGLGVAFYVIVHRRIRIKFIAKHPYMKRIMKAHYVHHKVHTREGAEAFGFLYAPKKYE
jgi:beta-carotene 3-hydroxylase